MPAEKPDLVAHLLADNRKLRQLYLAEQHKVLAERKRRITAEARLAAFLTKEVTQRRELNSSQCSRLEYDLSVVGKVNKENDRIPNLIDFSDGDHTTLSDINNLKKYRKRIIPTLESFTDYTTNSIRGVQDVNPAASDEKINLPHSVLSGERSADSLNTKMNNAQLPLTANILQNNFKPELANFNRFWLFIDGNGETKSSVPPPLSQIQQQRKEAFIRRSTERQILIQEASMCRKELAAVKRKVAKQLLAGHAVNKRALQVFSLLDREIRAFPPQAMEHETARRVCKTKEFQEKKKQRCEEYDAHINRLLAYCYSQAPHRFHWKK